jgi:phage terminase small subunit
VRGRKRMPSQLTELHGNTGKRPLLKREPIPQTGNLDEAPAWMTDSQKDSWCYAIAHAPPGLLKRCDQSLLTAWVVAEDLHRAACAAQAGQPLLVESSVKGVKIQSGYLAIINRQAVILMKAASELGFTPTARPRIGAFQDGAARSAKKVPKGSPTVPLDEFLDQNPLSDAVN